jgi:hypothetical protein
MSSKTLTPNREKIPVSVRLHRNRFFIAAVALLEALLLGGHVIRAQVAIALDPTTGFGMGYSYSIIYDVCGYPDLAPVLRGAIRQRVEQCPFPAESKKKFATEADRFDAALKPQLEAFSKQRDASAPAWLGDFNCPTAGFEEAVARLKKFAQNEISVAEFLPEPCEAGRAMAPPPK